jgi:hypothetical protein
VISLHRGPHPVHPDGAHGDAHLLAARAVDYGLRGVTLFRRFPLNISWQDQVSHR